ncbi:MAG: hypothetical protein WC901_01555 [Candidatus Margulisiibacteriota bacterium]
MPENIEIRPGRLAGKASVTIYRAFPDPLRDERKPAYREEERFVRQLVGQDHEGIISATLERLRIPAMPAGVMLEIDELVPGNAQTILRVKVNAGAGSFVLKADYREDSVTPGSPNLSQRYSFVGEAEDLAFAQIAKLAPECIAKIAASAKTRTPRGPVFCYTQELIPPQFFPIVPTWHQGSFRCFRHNPDRALSAAQTVAICRGLISDIVLVFLRAQNMGEFFIPRPSLSAADVMVCLDGQRLVGARWVGMTNCLVAQFSATATPAENLLVYLAAMTENPVNWQPPHALHLGYRGAFIEGALSGFQRAGEDSKMDRETLGAIFDAAYKGLRSFG